MIFRPDWLHYYPYPPYSPWPSFNALVGVVLLLLAVPGLLLRPLGRTPTNRGGYASVITLSHVTYHYPDQADAGAVRLQRLAGARRVRARRRPVGRGQVHLPAQPERPRAAFLRRAAGRDRSMSAAAIRSRWRRAAWPTSSASSSRTPRRSSWWTRSRTSWRSRWRTSALPPATMRKRIEEVLDQMGIARPAPAPHQHPVGGREAARRHRRRCWRSSRRSSCSTSRPRSSTRRPPRRC